MKNLILLMFVGTFSISINAQSVNYQWALPLGGASQDLGTAVTTDAAGNVYSTGFFRGTGDFDPGAGTTTLTSAGLRDVFIQKVNSNGDLIWAKSIGGPGHEFAQSIALDDNNNILLTGFFSGTADFDPGTGTSSMTSSGLEDVYVLKLDNNGDFLWAKSIGSPAKDVGNSITTDPSGNVILAGYYSGTLDFDPDPVDTYMSSPAGLKDFFILKLDPNGNFIWAVAMGGTSDDFATTVKTDALGNVYTGGTYQSTVNFNTGMTVMNSTSAGLSDYFIQKLDPNGNLIWYQVFGGTSSDRCTSLSIDASNNICVTGVFGETFDADPSTMNTVNLTSNGLSDIFVQKIDANGDLIWAKSMGGIEVDQGVSIASNATDEIFITGNFSGTADFDPSTIATENLTSNGLSDAFIVKLDPNGDLNWAKSFGGAGIEYGRGIATDNNGGVLTIGFFNGTIDFDPGTGVDMISSAANDGFVHKLSECYPDAVDDVLTVCNALTWIDGVTYTSDNNTATHTLTNMGGCDSLVTLDLTIVNGTTGTDVQTACGSFTWVDGITYTANNNIATDTIVGGAVNGCDSIVTLDLTISNGATGTDIQAACASFTWVDGITYTASNNIATDTIVGGALNGCDSIVTLDLTITNGATGTDVQTACNTFTWVDGITYTANNNIATDTIVGGAANGCDSIVTLDLTINAVDVSVTVSGVLITATAAGATYQWLDCDNNNSVITGETSQTFTPTINGNYAVEVQASGCTDTSACTIIDEIGIMENDLFGQVSIYPNPTNGVVNVELGNLKEASITIFNVTGDMIYSNKVLNESVHQIELDKEPGIYFIEVASNQKRVIFKLIRQ